MNPLDDMPLPYENRVHAGRVLADELRHRGYAHRGDVTVLALPRGGVPVAFEVAQALQAPMDVLLVRKLGVPGHEELAMGAIATGDARVLNQEIISRTGITRETIERITQQERAELLRRERAYRGDRPEPGVADRTVILIDDGLATGSTMSAAVAAIRSNRPAHIVVAVPVAPMDTCRDLEREVDEIICAATPEDFGGVGRWYENFEQTDDDEVRDLLDRAWKEKPMFSGSGAAARVETPTMPSTNASEPANVLVRTPDAPLEGLLAMPDGATGLVIFAHGSGSSRFSSRNQFVARTLNEAGLATLLFDLLTAAESEIDERTRELRFDIALLTRRLIGAVDWARQYATTRTLPLGLFGSSTGAAAALAAAAQRPDTVAAVVSRGGRVDLAGDALPLVQAPTLMIVGGEDRPVIDMNQQAASALHAEHRIEIIPNATHLFEEPGTLEQVANLARDWFVDRFKPAP